MTFCARTTTKLKGTSTRSKQFNASFILSWRISGSGFVSHFPQLCAESQCQACSANNGVATSTKKGTLRPDRNIAHVVPQRSNNWTALIFLRDNASAATSATTKNANG